VSYPEAGQAGDRLDLGVRAPCRGAERVVSAWRPFDERGLGAGPRSRLDGCLLRWPRTWFRGMLAVDAAARPACDIHRRERYLLQARLLLRGQFSAPFAALPSLREPAHVAGVPRFADKYC